MSAPAPVPTRRQLKVVCPHDCPDTCVCRWTWRTDGPSRSEATPTTASRAAFSAPRSTATSSASTAPTACSTRCAASGRKGEGRFERDLVGRGARRRSRGACGEIAARTGRRPSCPTPTRATWAFSPTAAWTGASSTRSGASLLDRTICATAGATGYKVTVGRSIGLDPEAVVHARLIVAWGANLVTSNVHLWPFVQEARRRGARLVTSTPSARAPPSSPTCTWLRSRDRRGPCPRR